MADIPQITVVAGVLYSPAGAVLLAQRTADRHMAGWWEFPGGKLEQGETPHAALVRELHEELAVQTLASRPLMSIHHRYPDREIHLLVREVLRYQGEPRGAEGQALEWVKADQLMQWPILPADKPVVRALSLPHQYVITPDLGSALDLSSACAPDQLADMLLRGLNFCLERGLRFFQLRLPGLDQAVLKPPAERALSLIRSVGGYLLINRDIELARQIGADGVHLKAAQLATLNERPADLAIVAASTHTPEELARAVELNCDFVCLGPVRRTLSHPDVRPMNWSGLKRHCAQTNLPVYALGGVQLEDFDQAREAGAVGVAGIRGFWPSVRSHSAI